MCGSIGSAGQQQQFEGAQQRRTRTKVMSWIVGLGGRMSAAKLLLPFLVLNSFCEASNQPPRFLNYFFSTYLLIYEDTPIGSSVAQLKAVDPEEEPLLFGVTGEESMRFFSVNPDTGVVWLRQQLDRETMQEMQVVFFVSDKQEVVKDTVNIQIGDVNDNAPTFHGQPYTVHIPEDTEEGLCEHVFQCPSLTYKLIMLPFEFTHAGRWKS
ncbi:Cadherin-23 [Oryzias melastigma]|uniref:Cadherin-23 n=1 Tax=Oryzias melastigma TaxID=30732 RepID=A0A834CA78_ORYME|nr:Cadherin-23 [Oryzias melastigma]